MGVSSVQVDGGGNPHRGGRVTQGRKDIRRKKLLLQAIQRGIEQFETEWNHPVSTTFTIQAQVPGGEPCLSVVDYVNWAVYRAFTTGEMRYYRVIEDKISLLVDLYDTTKYPYNWYSRRNPFDINKITPL